MKKLAYFLLAAILYLGLFRALRQSGMAGVTDWLSNPANYALMALPLMLLRWHRRVAAGIERMLWHHRANLAGPVSILVGTSDVLAARRRSGGGRRSRKWTILAAWAATLMVVASYLTMGGAALPTMALAAIAGLYWVCSTWRIYTPSAAAAVFLCAVPVLFAGDAAGALPMFYASGTLLIARSRRSMLVALGTIAVMEAFRYGVGTEALAVAAGIALFSDRLSVAWDSLAALVMDKLPQRPPAAASPAPQAR